MKNMNSLKLFLGLMTTLYASNVSAVTWYTDANLDYRSIKIVSHNSKFITIGDISYFSIIGNAYGVDSGIQGIYASQDTYTINRCLSLAEDINLRRKTSTRPLLRIQVQPDPTHQGFALIQYCTLYQ